jgi:hypothetical protein
VLEILGVRVQIRFVLDNSTVKHYWIEINLWLFSWMWHCRQYSCFAFQVFKSCMTEIICEDISTFFLHGNIFKSHSPFLKFLLRPKICPLEILYRNNGCQIFGYVYIAVIVTEECSTVSCLQRLHKILHRTSLVIPFLSWWYPMHTGRSKWYAKSCSTRSSIQTACPVWVSEEV